MGTWPNCVFCGKELTPDNSICFYWMYLCLGCADKASTKGSIVKTDLGRAKWNDRLVIDSKGNAYLEEEDA